MEEMANRSGELSFAIWEPFVWEFSSAVVLLLLIPAVNKFLQSMFISWDNPVRTALSLALGSIVFSVCHVTAMVAIRELVYWAAGSDYRFGAIGFGFIYEYRKDLLTFILVIVAIQGYKFIVSRLAGEASLIDYDEAKPIVCDRILVKKLGKEFIVKVDKIDWLESSGNYINLYVGDRIYPTRDTMASLIAKLKDQGICRIHRSYGVNLDRVYSMETLDGGTINAVLSTGKTLPVSRRYREQLKGRITNTQH